jgi:hypothetical protein
MPKCSCAGSSCSCQVQVGDGLTLTGTGNAAAPYVISLTQTVVSITQSATGTVDLSAVKSGSLVVIALSAPVTGLTLPTVPGTRIDLVFTQVTAGNTVTWGTAIKWPGGVAPVVSATINYSDWFALRALTSTAWVGAIEGQAIR